MKITILCENQVSEKAAKICLAEWGFSCFLEIKDKKILFDTGHTDVYLRNAKNLGVDIEKTDFVVLSHHHWDHSGGLRYTEFKSNKKLIIHPELIKKLPKNESKNIRNNFEIISSETPIEFFEDIFYLGQIPRTNNFEKGIYKNDKMLDDSALAIKSKKGAIVISGCSHSGICNICEYAKEVTKQKLYLVLGGFHLFEENKKAVDKTIEYFKKEKIKNLYPMHCVDFQSLVKFYENFRIKKLSAGDSLEIED